MALSGGTFGNGGGAGTGTVAVSLATILGSTRNEFRQLDVRAGANVGVIYVGDSGVGATDAWVQLTSGESWGLNPQAFTAPAGGDFKIDVSSIYIVGTAPSDQAFVSVLL